jgi:DNA-binding NarL/FixJ family response regulator
MLELSFSVLIAGVAATLVPAIRRSTPLLIEVALWTGLVGAALLTIADRTNPRASELTLGAGISARIRIRAEGPDEAQAVAAIVSAIENGLGQQTSRVQAGLRPTRRQVQILKLMAGGLSQKQVAGRLHLSNHTVRHHVSRLYASLGVHDSAHAVMSAVRAGLLEG